MKPISDLKIHLIYFAFLNSQLLWPMLNYFVVQNVNSHNAAKFMPFLCHVYLQVISVRKGEIASDAFVFKQCCH